MGCYIKIDVPEQSLQVFNTDGEQLHRYLISSAANGVGEVNGSGCTPRGQHIIRAMIGAGAAPNTVFVGRRETGEVFDNVLREKHPNRDWILTRIIWLSGTQVGVNRLGDVDTMRRYVYLHGTPDDVILGQPGSKGCIRMRNSDIIELFDTVSVGTEVIVHG